MVNMNEKSKKNNTFEEQLLEMKKKYNRRLISKISFIGIVFALLFAYLFTPLSQVNNYRLQGNLNLNEEEVLDICHIDRDTSLFLIDENECLNLLNNHPLIKKAKINNNIFGLNIEIEEITPILRTNDGNYYFNDGTFKESNFILSPSIPERFVDLCMELPVSLNEFKLSEEDILLFSDIYFSLSEEFRTKIKYYNIYDDKNISFFYFDEYTYEVKITLPNNIKNIDDISYAIDKEAHQRYINEFLSKNDSGLVIKKYQNNLTSFEYYSILVKIEYEFGTNTANYIASPNN